MNRELIRTAFDLVHIRDVTLLSHAVKLEGEFDPKVTFPPHAVNLQWGAQEGAIVLLGSDAAAPQDAFWNVKFQTQARIIRREDGKALPADATEFRENEVIASFSAMFLACYFYKGAANEAPNDVALQEFARYNVPLHVWPYWREWLQSTCVRIGLPAIQLPQQIFDGQLAAGAGK